jgi:hypothetical protein
VARVGDLLAAGGAGRALVVTPGHALVGEQGDRAAAPDADRDGVLVVGQVVAVRRDRLERDLERLGSIMLKNASVAFISPVVARLSRSIRRRASASRSACASRTGRGMMVDMMSSSYCW